MFLLEAPKFCAGSTSPKSKATFFYILCLVVVFVVFVIARNGGFCVAASLACVSELVSVVVCSREEVSVPGRRFASFCPTHHDTHPVAYMRPCLTRSTQLLYHSTHGQAGVAWVGVRVVPSFPRSGRLGMLLVALCARPPPPLLLLNNTHHCAQHHRHTNPGYIMEGAVILCPSLPGCCRMCRGRSSS